MASWQFKLGRYSYLLQFRMGFFILCLLFSCIFSGLGVWQLYRYHYKLALVETYQFRLASSPKPFEQVVRGDDLQFQRVLVKGRYLNVLTLLIQNKFYQGQAGFEVLTPLQMPGQKKLLLVDRGWVAKSANESLPHIDVVSSEQHVTGYLKLIDEQQFILGKNILNSIVHPIVMQKIDLDEVSRITHYAFYPFILRLDASQPNGFVRDWIISTVPPARHIGYAIQWFLFALIVFIGYLAFSSEKQNANKK